MRLALFILQIFFVIVVQSFNILVYTSTLMESHVNFMAALADILVDEQHNVTLLVNELRPELGHRSLKVPYSNIITMQRGSLPEMQLVSSMLWTSDGGVAFQSKVMTAIGRQLQSQCKHLLDSDLLQNIQKNTKFDLVIHEVFDVCGLAIVEILKAKHIIVSSTRPMDTVPYATGILNPIFEPSILSNFSLSIPLNQVTLNFAYMRVFLRFTGDQENYISNVLKKKYSVKTPLWDSIRSSSCFFVNTHPMVDVYRPYQNNIFDVGGIAVEEPTDDSINKKIEPFMESLQTYNHVVLISFGTALASSAMPQELRQGLISVMHSLPDVLFIWKYETEEVENELRDMTNVIRNPFLPQNELLRSGFVSLFITHGGQNSVLEAASAGVPMLVVPIFGDQMRNAWSVQMNGIGSILRKSQLSNATWLAERLQIELKDKELKNRCSAVSRAMRNPAFSAREIFLRNVEYAASMLYRTLISFGYMPVGGQSYKLDVPRSSMWLWVCSHRSPNLGFFNSQMAGWTLVVAGAMRKPAGHFSHLTETRPL